MTRCTPVSTSISWEAPQPEGKQLLTVLLSRVNKFRIIAIMLGTLRMDIDTCIGEYNKIFQKTFPVTKYKEKVNDLMETHQESDLETQPKSDLESQEKFDPKHLEDMIRKLVAEHFGDNDAPINIETRESLSYPQCKVLVIR